MALADGAGLPLAVCIGSASPHEVRFVHETLAARFIDDVPERPIGDLAYDGDQLRFELSDDGIDAVGRSSGCSRGCTTFGGSWCAMSGTLRTDMARVFRTVGYAAIGSRDSYSLGVR